MNNEEIATELRKRAEEMRALPPGVWVNRSPRHDGEECAVRRGPLNHLLSPTTHALANRWVQDHDLARALSVYNDVYALDQFDVANVLDKIAEDIS